MKIGKKLTSGFILVAIMAGIVGGIGVYSLNKTNKEYTSLYENYGVPMGDIGRAQSSFQELRVSMRNIAMTVDMEKRNQIAESMNVEYQKIVKYLEAFKKSIQTEGTMNDYKKLMSDLDVYFALQEKLVTFAKASQDAEVLNILQDPASAAVVTNVKEDVEKLFNRKDERGQELLTENIASANQTMIVLVGVVICAVIVAVILGVALSRSLSKAINQMVQVAEQVAEGNLDVDVLVKGKDELGMLARSLSKMTDNLNDVMSNINAASEQVSDGSNQLADSSMALSQGATEQASSIEQLSASIEEIASQTRINAENAKEANVITETARVSAIEGNERMTEMMKAMEDINDSSSNISKIIKVIDDIAFQTNILALNAAVEAARAGQHGKGFAVVAEEVRNLAARSANAAKETTVMIEGSVKKAEGGTKIASETAESLTKIVRGIENVAELIGNIAVASDEQAAGIAQINQGILQVSTVIQTNSATSQESAAASEELASQAVLLEDQVSRFKLRKIRGYVPKRNEDPSYNQSEKQDESKAEKKNKKIILSDQEFGKY